MEYRSLGSTGLKVSRICFGTLTLGPLQARTEPREAGKLLALAVERGINFFDTAELYGTYVHIREGLAAAKALGVDRSQIVISSRSYAHTYEGMRKSVESALREIGTDYIDIFGLHEQVSRLTLAGHREALEYLLDAKAEGKVRAVAVSTHSVDVVDACATLPGVDVVHPLFNIDGLGILDGGASEMAEAMKKAHEAGRGIYSMKALGGGNLLSRLQEALKFVLEKDYIDSVAVGMRTPEEVDINIRILAGAPVAKEELDHARSIKRLHVESWCVGCGACVAACSQGALRIESGRVVVDEARCLLCGYCSARCPEFCLKVI